jgi:mono/diheme cytochrome c family protein
MTEVPEHLLRRSRERREALGLGGDGGGAGGGGDEAPAAASAPAPAAASSEVAPQAAAASPAVPEPEPEPAVAYVAKPDPGRSRNPLWVMPVLVALPMWALFYAYAFAPAKKAGPVDPLVRGGEVYRANCSSCHGAAGEGGVGPALQHGEAKLTFPTEADHIKWVQTGSGPAKGQKYGDANRPGGQHGPAQGIMPAFSGTLSQADIEAVVKFEREKL